MAASISTRILEDGNRNAVLEIVGTNGASGGSGGLDLPYTVFILPAGLTFAYQPRKLHADALAIDQIDWDINAEAGMQVNLYWDTATPPVVGTTVPAMTAIGRKTDKLKAFGGLTPPSSLVAPTGGLGIATLGASSSNYNGFTIFIRLRKLLSNQV